MQENKHLKYTVAIKKADLIVFWKVFSWKLEEDFLMIFIYFQLLILIIFLVQTGLRKCLPQHVWRLCSVGERRKDGWF